MKTTLPKSIGAILAGLVLGAVLSILTDTFLEKAELMKRTPFVDNSTGLILFVVLYRIVFNVSGSYLTAKLAPSKPMKHALILGLTGFILAIAGVIVMWDTPPRWYSLTVAFVSLPCAWLGGILVERNSKPSYKH